MNISTLLGTNAATSSSGALVSSQSAGVVSTPVTALSKADKRLQTLADETTAELSKFGLLKSALADLNSSGQALGSFSHAASASEVTVATGKFFSAFNATVAAATQAAGAHSSAAKQSATRVGNDLKHALGSDPLTEGAMKKLGLAIQKDGVLVHDAKKFALALTNDPAGTIAAVGDIGKRVAAAGARELAATGTVTEEIATLTQYGKDLTAQLNALRATESKRSPSQASAASTSHSAAAYQAHAKLT